jgi:hypothetical protein
MNPNQLSTRFERIVRAIQAAGDHQAHTPVIAISRLQTPKKIRTASLLLIGIFLVFGFGSGNAAPPATTKTEAVENPKFSGVISGRAVDSSGKPIARAKIVLYELKRPSQRFGHMVPQQSPTMSDVNGGFRFEELADGYYFIEVKKNRLCHDAVQQNDRKREYKFQSRHRASTPC